MNKKNLFLAFEGIDGSGKSTQSKMLEEKMKADGIKVYHTFEPTDSYIGTLIRKIFRHEIEADHRTIAGLYVADRINHLTNDENGIVKKLQEGYTVITDRYYFSSYAYQGTHMSQDWVINANSISADVLRPDLNIFIDITPEVAIERLHNNRGQIQLYETLDNLKAVRDKYFEAFEKLKDKEQVFIVDGNRPLDTIFSDITKKLESI
jgi:dTMP kinase